MSDGDRTATRQHAALEDVLAAIYPGEAIEYTTLLSRMKFLGRATSGVGMLLEAARFRRCGGGELVTWREPYWDTEVEGGWAEGTLWIKRRDDRPVEVLL